MGGESKDVREGKKKRREIGMHGERGTRGALCVCACAPRRDMAIVVHVSVADDDEGGEEEPTRSRRNPSSTASSAAASLMRHACPGMRIAPRFTAALMPRELSTALVRWHLRSSRRSPRPLTVSDAFALFSRSSGPSGTSSAVENPRRGGSPRLPWAAPLHHRHCDDLGNTRLHGSSSAVPPS